MSETGMLLSACVRKPEYDVLIVKGFIFIHDEKKSVGELLLALVQGLSNVSTDISDSSKISFWEVSLLQPSHHFIREGKEEVSSCCAVSCGHSKLEED